MSLTLLPTTWLTTDGCLPGAEPSQAEFVLLARRPLERPCLEWPVGVK